jgi:Uma2 family endonuclease
MVTPALEQPLEQAHEWTADELLALPEDERYELVEGKLIAMAPPPGLGHGLYTNRLNYMITAHVLQNKLGVVVAAETGFRLRRRPDTVQAADVAFVTKQRRPKKLPMGGIPRPAPGGVLSLIA